MVSVTEGCKRPRLEDCCILLPLDPDILLDHLGAHRNGLHLSCYKALIFCRQEAGALPASHLSHCRCVGVDNPTGLSKAQANAPVLLRDKPQCARENEEDSEAFSALRALWRAA